MERVARGLIAILNDDPERSPVEHSEKKSCFKIKTSDLGIKPG